MVWNPVSVKKARSIRNAGSRQLALCMVGAPRASEAPSEAIAAGIGIEARPWPPSATLLSRLGDKHFLQEEKQPSNILKMTITKVYLFAKNKMLFLQKYTHAQTQQSRLHCLYPLCTPSLHRTHVCLPAKQVVLRHWTSHVTLNSS